MSSPKLKSTKTYLRLFSGRVRATVITNQLLAVGTSMGAFVSHDNLPTYSTLSRGI